jgi:CheY-like chemotaxis protein
VGIAPDKLEAIFGEFTRLGQVEAEGLGLGLALVERIARLLGGRIEVASRPDRGSRFSLLLPAHDAADPAVLPVAAKRKRKGRFQPLDILVVDNDARIVEATGALLAQRGHRPHGAAGMGDALALGDGVDAVLADYQLDNGEDGLSVIEALRARRPELPALLITAESSDTMYARAAALDVPVLSKPVAPEAIERFLADLPNPAASVVQV